MNKPVPSKVLRTWHGYYRDRGGTDARIIVSLVHEVRRLRKETRMRHQRPLCAVHEALEALDETLAEHRRQQIDTELTVYRRLTALEVHAGLARPGCDLTARSEEDDDAHSDVLQ